MDFRRTVLPGGLRVISERVPGVRSAAVGLWIGIGSRDETPALAGAAHYLEHLLFKATGRRSAARIAEEIDAVGGELNAFTAKEHTCFYAHVLDTDLPLAIDLVTDVVFDGLCTEADTETERSVVLEEIAMRDDDPEDLLHDVFAAAVMGEHPLGKPVLGTEESVASLEASALGGFHRAEYRLGRMVLAVAGNIDHDEVVRLTQKSLAAFDLADRTDAEPYPPRRGKAELTPVRDVVLHQDDTEQTHLMLGLGGVSRHDERRFALSVLSTALGGGMSSRLFQEIRERRGLAYQVYSAVDSYSDTGQLAVYAGTQPERLGDVAEVLRTVLADVAANGMTEAEVARAKGQLRGGLVLGLEDTASWMSRIGRNELDYGRYFPVDDSLARIDAVTAADVAALAGELLGDVQAAVVVGPYPHHDALPGRLLEVMV